MRLYRKKCRQSYLRTKEAVTPVLYKRVLLDPNTEDRTPTHARCQIASSMLN